MSKQKFNLQKKINQMLAVRKNLTEILLEVTNEIIEVVANETISKMRTKGQKFNYQFQN